MNHPESSGLLQLAVRLCDCADHQATTPVMITADDLELRPEFYVQLFADVMEISGRGIDVELISGHAGWLRAIRDHRRNRTVEAAARILNASDGNTRLASTSGRPAVNVTKRLVISRAAGQTRAIRVGVASDSVIIPAWASAIRLTRYAQVAGDIQVVPVSSAA